MKDGETVQPILKATEAAGLTGCSPRWVRELADKKKLNSQKRIVRTKKLDGKIMKNVLTEITRLRVARGWNEYELAKHCELSQSTISTWYRKNQMPTIQTLDKVCKGLGITLSQFFAEGNDAVSLTPEQRDMLDHWSALNVQQKQIVRDLLKSMHWEKILM